MKRLSPKDAVGGTNFNAIATVGAVFHDHRWLFFWIVHVEKSRFHLVTIWVTVVFWRPMV